jgi:mRNA-degrading endonuclease RelE of RelBE toxin-antitoxin system
VRRCVARAFFMEYAILLQEAVSAKERPVAYRIEYTDSAIEDIAYFKKYERGLIVTAIEEQLTHEPLREVRNRKPLEPNLLARWEVRVGKYRIFYDVEISDMLVLIIAVGWKEHNTLYIRGKEYQL